MVRPVLTGMAASGVDVLHTGAHSASIFDLSRSMGEGVQIVDFCIPCNPYFPTPEMFDELTRDLRKILKHYPSDSSTITAKLSSVLGLHPQTVAMANGSTELITWIDHLLIKSSVAIPIPTFGRWTDQPLETGKRVDMFPLRERDGFKLDLDEYVQFIRERGSRVAVVCNVNNPDGGYLNRRDVIRFMDDLADLDLVVIDESFIDFSDVEQFPSVGPEAVIRPNVVVLKSLGKNFGLHGIRFGYLMANPAIAGKIAKALPKWNLNSLAEKVVFMIEDHQDDYAESLRLLSRDRRSMAAELGQLPDLKVFPSQGNFILVKLQPEWSGVELRDYLVANHAVYTRECGNKLGMTSQFMRLVVRPAADVDRLIDGIEDYGDKVRAESANEPWSTTGPSWSNSTSSASAPSSPAPWSEPGSRAGSGPAHAARSESRPDSRSPDADDSRSGSRSDTDRSGADRADARSGDGPRTDSWQAERPLSDSWAEDRPPAFRPAARPAGTSRSADRADSRRDEDSPSGSWSTDRGPTDRGSTDSRSRGGSRHGDRPATDPWPAERPPTDHWAAERPSTDHWAAERPSPDRWPADQPPADPWSTALRPTIGRPGGSPERASSATRSSSPGRSASRGPAHADPYEDSYTDSYTDSYADEPTAERAYERRRRVSDDEPDDVTPYPPRRTPSY